MGLRRGLRKCEGRVKQGLHLSTFSLPRPPRGCCEATSHIRSLQVEVTHTKLYESRSRRDRAAAEGCRLLQATAVVDCQGPVGFTSSQTLFAAVHFPRLRVPEPRLSF